MAYFDFFSWKKDFLHPCWVLGTQHWRTPSRGGAYSGLEAWGSGTGAGIGPCAVAGPEAVSESARGSRAGTWVDAEAMFVRLALPEVEGPLHCSPLFSSLSFFLISFTSALSCRLSALRRCRSALRTVLSPRRGNLVWNVIRNTYLLTIKSWIFQEQKTITLTIIPGDRNLAARTFCSFFLFFSSILVNYLTVSRSGSNSCSVLVADYLNSPDIPCSGMERGVLVLTRLWLGSWLCRHISHRMQDGHTLHVGVGKKTNCFCWYVTCCLSLSQNH